VNCNELDNYLHEFLDNELAADKRTEVANHLASCRHCAVRVAEFEQADRQLRTMKAVAPPADFLQQVRQKIEAEEKATERVSVRTGIEPPESFWESVVRRFTLPFWVKVPLAAAAALVLVFVLFNTTQPRQTPIPATYQLTRNEVDKAKNFQVAPAREPAAANGEHLRRESRDVKSAIGGDLVDERNDFVQAIPKPESAPTMGEELPKEEMARLTPPPSKEPAAGLTGGKFGGEAPAVSAKAEPEVVAGKEASGGSYEYGMAEKKPGDKSEATKTAEVPLAKAKSTNDVSVPPSVAAAPPPASPAVTAPGRTRAGKAGQKDADLFAKVDRPSVTNLATVRQSGWLDLSTQTFYLEFGKASAGGAFVRGRLDEKSKFVVTSAQVEGQVIELDERSAGSRGTYGWLELSSREFVPSRPGLKPSYPYIEGYKDRQGEFHPTSRRIYTAGN
jgi:negative regulator of sigma E activity